MVSRHIPTGTIIKTGTLRDVSALAGVMPTRDRGLVCFAIINRGGDVDGFRKQQDQILQKLVQRWGVPPTLPAAILPSTGRADIAGFLGDASRNEILSDFQARR
jgi:D-alanyl-D-alanine carboxypeptidase/D-alanyl-D-alanine-endopeptidase (penicillin-binding protein 4)